jgi:hypothetical protein
VTLEYVWNTNRTLQTETVQNTIANQQRVTAYNYPTTNYGLPTGVGKTGVRVIFFDQGLTDR